jgi:two-component system CAI-1 autoinducer sensor kinase/phosphatase CqsS
MFKTFNLSSLKLDLFSIIAVLMNCIFINIYAYEYQMTEIDLILNASIIAYIFCMISLAMYFMERFISKETISILWLICVIYGIGFLPSYTALITGGKKYLVLNFSSSLLLLAMMTDWMIFMIVSVLGITSAFIIYFITNIDHRIDLLHPEKQTYFIYYIVSYTFIGISLSMRNKEKVQEKKLDFMKVFGSAIAHEVNAPLSSMSMMADVLELIINGMQVKKKGHNYILIMNEMDYEMLTTVIKERLKRAANDAIQIVEMLLAALREKYTDKKAVAKMSFIVQEAIYLASHLDLSGKKINLKIDKEFEITGSVKLLKHVIYNLIKNSFKHGGDDVEVLIEIKPYEVIVSDNGIGIHKEKIEHIFNAFFTNGNGSGIGLAFAKFVLDDMNASIGCESEVGQFTRFKIKFNSFSHE